jgi:hypothetical protein
MSDIKKLLEAMDSMAAVEEKSTGPAWPGYWKGTDTAKKSRGRMVGDGGAAESVEEDLEESLRQQFAEYGAPGSAIGNDTGTNPAEQAMLRQQQNLQKRELRGQATGLSAQLGAARSQLAQLNKAFPQGADPVEKAMALRDIQGQKVGIQNQIQDLTSQIAALRSHAL